jgi:hypothetical protein
MMCIVNPDTLVTVEYVTPDEKVAVYLSGIFRMTTPDPPFPADPPPPPPPEEPPPEPVLISP